MYVVNKGRPTALSKKVTIGFAILPAAAGSIVTFMFVFAALAGLLAVIRKRIPVELTKYDRIIIYPAIAFFIINALSTIRPDFNIHDLTSLVPSLLFLLPYFFIKQYRYVGNEDQFSLFVKAIPYGAFLLLPWMIYQGLYLDSRMVGGAGNAIPFGMICALMAPISLVGSLSKDRAHKLISVFGFIIFTIGLVLSQSRSMYLAVVPNVFIALGYLFYVSKRKLKVTLFSVAIILFSSLFALNSSTIAGRISQLINPLSSLLAGVEIKEESVGHRVALLRKGLCFAQNKIVSGYGISNRREVLTSEEIQAESYFSFCDKSHGVFYYSHFHNGFLTSFIDAGIFGLLATIFMLFAPLTLALVSPKDEIKPCRIVIALCLTSVYIMAGVTNLLFGHDLIDGMFLIFSSFLALSIRTKSNNKGIIF